MILSSPHLERPHRRDVNRLDQVLPPELLRRKNEEQTCAHLAAQFVRREPVVLVIWEHAGKPVQGVCLLDPVLDPLRDSERRACCCTENAVRGTWSAQDRRFLALLAELADELERLGEPAQRLLGGSTPPHNASTSRSTGTAFPASSSVIPSTPTTPMIQENGYRATRLRSPLRCT